MADHGRPEDEVVVDLEEPAPAAAAPAEADVVELPEGEGAADAPRLPRQAVLLPDGRVKLPLRYPVTLRMRQAGQVREESYAELEMHRLTGADLRAIIAAGDNAGPTALSRTTRIPLARCQVLYDRMDAADVMAAVEVVGFFMPAGRTTGR